MKRTLLIMRHAQAKNDEHLEDIERELKDKGKRNAQKVGIWMAQQKISPEMVISSPAERSIVTAEKTLKASGHSVDLISLDNRLYNARAVDVFDVIRGVSNSVNTLMIVGHNPSLELAMAELSNGSIPKTKKGCIAQFEIECDWQDIKVNCASLIEMVFPKKLKEGFPYPGVFSAERRIRPSYYYSQSCVIPYRLFKRGLEVMIVTSSNNKHWVLPKGIHEPGLSAQASAANEAFEEAGISGRVHELAIGQYVYEKWQAPCTVSVFPMEVSTILDESHWEESHRMRKWCSILQATDCLENPDLVNILNKLPDYLESQK